MELGQSRAALERIIPESRHRRPRGVQRFTETARESRLLETLSHDELASLRREAESELAEQGRWGTTFILIQSSRRREGWDLAAPYASVTEELARQALMSATAPRA